MSPTRTISGQEALNDALYPTEAQWQREVLRVAKEHGWLAHHCRAARTQSGRWATPIQGDAGFPDLVLVRPLVATDKIRGTLLFVELKVGRGVASVAQQRWLRALMIAGAQWRLWRPSDYAEMERTLREG